MVTFTFAAVLIITPKTAAAGFSHLYRPLKVNLNLSFCRCQTDNCRTFLRIFLADSSRISRSSLICQACQKWRKVSCSSYPVRMSTLPIDPKAGSHKWGGIKQETSNTKLCATYDKLAQIPRLKKYSLAWLINNLSNLFRSGCIERCVLGSSLP